jgi:hypothetical protein
MFNFIIFPLLLVHKHPRLFSQNLHVHLERLQFRTLEMQIDASE